MMNLIGADIQGEILTDKGRIDGVIELDDKIYVIEFKTGNVNEGMKQIKARKYYEKYATLDKRVLILSVGGFNDKNIEYMLEEVN
jgi:ATP-dependent exoDNAse (exonuclease V) beta subunit